MKQSIPLTLQALPDLFNWIASHAELDPTALSHVELAVEEAFVNIMNHSGLTPQDSVEVDIQPIPTGIKIVLKDKGIPFNPLKHPAPDQNNHSEGGYGIYIMRHYMNIVDYEWKDRFNVLTLIKRSLPLV